MKTDKFGSKCIIGNVIKKKSRTTKKKQRSEKTTTNLSKQILKID